MTPLTETTTNYLPVITTKVRLERMGQGQLRIHSAYKDGELVAEVFTLESLAHVLGMPMSTMDGRYARGKLAKWNVPVINGYGRPARGFPLPLLNDVINIIQTKGACVGHDVNGSGPATVKPVRQANDLRPEYFNGKQYFTIPSIAVAFGFSETTVRKKLERAGLMRKFVDLAAPRYGGRPKRGIASTYLADIKLAITEGVAFMNAAERVLNQAARTQAQADMVASIAPHEPPVGMQAWDADALAPVRPVNGVNPVDDAEADALADEIESIMAQAKPVSAELPAAPDHTTTEPTPEQMFQAAWEFQVTHLAAQDEEPTEDDLRETAEMLELSKADAERFVAEVRAKRGAA